MLLRLAGAIGPVSLPPLGIGGEPPRNLRYMRVGDRSSGAPWKGPRGTLNPASIMNLESRGRSCTCKPWRFISSSTRWIEPEEHRGKPRCPRALVGGKLKHRDRQLFGERRGLWGMTQRGPADDSAIASTRPLPGGPALVFQTKRSARGRATWAYTRWQVPLQIGHPRTRCAIEADRLSGRGYANRQGPTPSGNRVEAIADPR